jgi:alpha-L-rhamnosidase
MAPPTLLRCEYFVNPLGIDERRPRFSWQLDDDRRGARQTAYQVVVTCDGEPIWDSAKVESDQSVHVEYAGEPLRSRQRCEWRVRTWDQLGQASDFSAPATFEIGFLDRGDWKAKWIAAPIVGGPYSVPPAAYLRKEFAVEKPIASARLYVTALGLYEFEINGRRIGDYVLTPGRTEYTKRVPYHVFDVSSHLSQSANCCGAILGDGWYCGHLHSDPRQTYGDRPRLLAQLEIRFTDGSSQTIVSDESWTAGEGPIRSSDMLMGEDYDARMEIAGWSEPLSPSSGGTREAFDSWRPAVVFPDPEIEIVAHRAPPMRRIQEIKPIAAPTRSANRRRHLFDLGQNMVGWVRLRVRNAPTGRTIDLRFAEMLDRDGKPYTTALRTARATDHYTTKGGAEEVFEPRFTFHGFRYVEVRDYPGEMNADDITGVVVHSDCELTGEFECSDSLVNQLQHNILWSQKGNFLDIPTDCPQRDERLGWTGDAQVFCRTAAFNMDVANFFAKWLDDVADAQFDDGHIPSVVPHVRTIHHEGGPAWADACIICPWTIYQAYGDRRIIQRCWPMMTRFVKWMIDTSPGLLRPAESSKWKGYGDWLSIGATTPPELIGTAYFAYCANLMSKMAKVLRDDAAEVQYRKLFEDVRAAWVSRFVDNTGGLKVQTQTACVLALHFELLPEALRPKVLDALVKDIESRDMHLSTGFVGTPYLNHALSDLGRVDVAYELLFQKTFPSWLFPVTHGATTMWERWDGWTPEKGFNDAGMNSYNHYAYGAIGEWMYSVVGGIGQDPTEPGYRHIVIHPQIGGGLRRAAARLKSLYGLIQCEWSLKDDLLHLNVTIPPNTSATIHVQTLDPGSVRESGRPASESPGLRFIGTGNREAIYEATAGRYSFQASLGRQTQRK